MNEDYKDSIKRISESFKKIDFSWMKDINNDVMALNNASKVLENMNYKNPLIEAAEEQSKTLKEVGEYLKTLVELNGNISEYNRELVSLNEKILRKINTLDETLEFINNTLTDKVENDKAQSNTRNALLLELITIMDSKDENRLKKFLMDLPSSVSLSLITQFLLLKLGLS